LGRHPPDELLNLARLAEEGGYDGLWYADEKFYRDPYLSLLYVASETKRLKLGVGVTDPFTRHPAITAMAAATLAELIPGRFHLGIGAGYSGLYSLGIRREKPATAMREGIQLMRRLWSGEEFDYHGDLVHFSRGRLDFTPPGNRVPITIAATGRKMLELAGEIADDIMIGDYASERTLGVAMDHLRIGATRSGRSLADCSIAARVNVALGEDSASAIQAMKRSVALSLWITYPNWKYYLDYSPEWEDHLAPFKDFLRDRGARPRNPGDYSLVEPYLSLVSDEMVHHRHLAGTIDEVVEQVSMLPSLGINRLIIYPVLFQEQSIVSITQTFAEKVMPRVRQSIGEDSLGHE
jgi:5,10-methylenetetrahydromethanopterin reductase